MLKGISDNDKTSDKIRFDRGLVFLMSTAGILCGSW